MIRLPVALGALILSNPLHALEIERTEETVRILDGSMLVSEYRTDWRVPYLYPLVSPSGANVTRHWPMDDTHPGEERDHPHHRSFWLSHGAVNGFDFWAFHDGKDARIEHQSVVSTSAENDSATFTVDLAWTAGGRTHLKEKRTHTFRKADEKTLLVDVTSELTATGGDVLFGDTKEGMFALRMDRTLRVNGRSAKAALHNSEGDKDGAAWGKRARWIATTGPDESGEPVVVAMFDHPSNLRHPTWWHARDYGLSAANPFGIHDFEDKPGESPGDHTLPDGESLRFHYRVVLHHGTLESAALPAKWEQFSTDPETHRNP